MTVPANARAGLGGAVREEKESGFRAKAREGRRGFLRPDAGAQTTETPMSEFHHDADDGHEAHNNPADLLAEAGLDRRAITEVLRWPGEAE